MGLLPDPQEVPLVLRDLVFGVPVNPVNHNQPSRMSLGLGRSFMWTQKPGRSQQFALATAVGRGECFCWS